MFLTDLFLDYFPAYNKFRAVSMILVVAEFTVPLLAIIALDTALKFKKDSKLIIENNVVGIQDVGNTETSKSLTLDLSLIHI